MNDKLNITIRIANQPPIPLTIKRDEEELIRQAESNVNRLWATWSERFNTSPEAILAMVAFQFAKLHAAISAEQSKSVAALKELNDDIDRLLAEGSGDSDAVSK
ncbi:MAG: cell division protein ZapA [Bacteroides sp.]|nr:cell division protein ZapA [Bacteroides sp.]